MQYIHPDHQPWTTIVQQQHFSETVLEGEKVAKSTVLHSFQWKSLLLAWQKEGTKEGNWRNYEREVELRRRTRANTHSHTDVKMQTTKQILFLSSLGALLSFLASVSVCENPSVSQKTRMWRLFITRVFKKTISFINECNTWFWFTTSDGLWRNEWVS